MVAPQRYILGNGAEVEAMQLTKENINKVSRWSGGKTILEWVESDDPKHDDIALYLKFKRPNHSDESDKAYPGDWVAKGVKPYQGIYIVNEETFKQISKPIEG